MFHRCAGSAFLLILSFHSPAGSESLSFACVQNKVTKENTPPTPALRAALRYSMQRAGPETRPTKTWASDIRAGELPLHLRCSAAPQGAQVKTKRCNAAVWLLTHPPVGDAEKRSADGSSPGPMSEAHVLCGPSLGPGPLARASQGSPKGRHLRVAFSWFRFRPKEVPGGDGEAKEGTRSPQGSETTTSRERLCLRSDVHNKSDPMDSRFRGNDGYSPRE